LLKGVHNNLFLILLEDWRMSNFLVILLSLCVFVCLAIVSFVVVCVCVTV
jgi:hypothetical protein